MEIIVSEQLIEIVAREMANVALKEAVEKFDMLKLSGEDLSMIGGSVSIEHPWLNFGCDTEEEFYNEAWKMFISPANVAVNTIIRVNGIK